MPGAQLAERRLLEGRTLGDDRHGQVLHSGRLLGDHALGDVRVDGLHTVGARC